MSKAKREREEKRDQKRPNGERYRDTIARKIKK